MSKNFYNFGKSVNVICDQIEQLKEIDPQTIKSVSFFAIVVGCCLIYFTMRFYGEY